MIGLVLGTLVAKVGIPSFVVTLAAFLAFQGVVLLLIKGGTNISIQRPGHPGHRQQVPAAAGWAGLLRRRHRWLRRRCSCCGCAAGAAAG